LVLETSNDNRPTEDFLATGTATTIA